MKCFKYKKKKKKEKQITEISLKLEPKKKEKISVAVCGVGGFAKMFHLPNLNKITDFEIHSIMSRDGGNATKAANDYHAAKVTTDYRDILNDEDIDVVIITTRHNLHFQYVVDALNAGKNVFVEKPLCLNAQELTIIEETLKRTKGGLMVGYNRRFSPHSKETYQRLRVVPLHGVQQARLQLRAQSVHRGGVVRFEVFRLWWREAMRHTRRVSGVMISPGLR